VHPDHRLAEQPALRLGPGQRIALELPSQLDPEHVIDMVADLSTLGLTAS
jgi:hypothetical protein